MKGEAMKMTQNQEALKEIWNELLKDLSQINAKLDKIIQLQQQILKRYPKPMKIGKPLDAVTLLELPDHLRKTALVILKLGECSAQMVADETGRARAVESSYLNTLMRQGYIRSKRKGRTVYFSVEPEAS